MSTGPSTRHEELAGKATRAARLLYRYVVTLLPQTVDSVVRSNVRANPDGVAFVDIPSGNHITWAEYNLRAELIADAIRAARIRFTDANVRCRIGLFVPDGIRAHLAFLACEKAGVVALGIGARSGDREINHLLRRTRAQLLVTARTEAARLRSISDVPVLVLEEVEGIHAQNSLVDGTAPPVAFTDLELWFLNSTSGTTGLPKVVRHNQRRWFEFHALASDAGRLAVTDTFASLLPAPFGFGLWTSHFTPSVLAAPCFVADRFDPSVTLAAIEKHRITVLAAVPTQLAIMMACADFRTRDLSSLRVVFTGGEMLPYERGVEFEEQTGAAILQFFGSNETGALSRTTLDDSQAVRLRTAGRLIPAMNVRLVDVHNRDVSATGGPAIPCGRGPLLSLGYEADDEANAALYTSDGWMKMGDLVTVDPASNYPLADTAILTVVGRTADLIIRGGKNISAAEVESEVSKHPSIALVAAAAIPDPIFGERVCAYIVLRTGFTLELAELTAFLNEGGVGRELWPESIVAVEGDLPRNAGGKVAKHLLASLQTDGAAMGSVS